MWFSTTWKYIQNPSQSPSTRTHTSFRHLHFPTKKAPANQVTDAFVNIIIPVQNNLSSQVPHPGPRRTIIPRNTEGQPSIFQNNRSHRNIFHPVIKPLIERDLYHRTITSHFKRHNICGYRRTGFHAGIWTSGNHWWSPWNLRIQNGLSIHNKTENERNSERK